jgi:Kyakuja-Dileera-Zisupton transposase
MHPISFDSIQCIDACFQQVHCHGTAGDIDIELVHTCFLTPADIASVKNHVESQHGTKLTRAKASKGTDDLEAEDHVEPGLRVPDSVLDSCERSFLAANEHCEKASTSAFVDMGLMGMICHHDWVILMVNVTSAGEKQYYAVALLEALFCELPTWWRVGVLYDVGCNLHCSTVKVS